MSIVYSSQPLGGYRSDFERWGMLPAIPETVLEVVSRYDDPFIEVLWEFDELPEDFDTPREFSWHTVLESSRGFRVVKWERSTVSTQLLTVSTVRVETLPAKRWIATNASLGDRPDEGCYIECYGQFPEGEYLSEEFMTELKLCPRKIWDIWGNELPPDTPVLTNLYGWQNAFKAGAQ